MIASSFCSPASGASSISIPLSARRDYCWNIRWELEVHPKVN